MTYTSHNAAPKRLVGFSLVVLFHVFIIYILASGLGSSVVKVITGPLETKFVEDVKQEKKTPPPPPPKLETPPPFIPPPEVAINMPSETGPTTAISNATTTRPAAPAAPAIASTPAKAIPGHPNSRPPYPPTSRRLEEQGTVILNLYVLEDGKVSQATVRKSSGSERLDDAAVREAMRSWRFLPATQGGKPIASWHAVAVTFRLEQ